MRSRVEIPPYTDRWMMGDQYGTVVDYLKDGIVKVRLDKSGKVVKVYLDDCRVIL